MDKNKLLKKYSDNLERSENRNHYLKYARDFLDNAGGLDRGSIDQYVMELQKRYKPGTVNFAFRVIRRLFAVNKLPWEYRQGEAPPIGQRDEYRPQLSPNVIEMMIKTATTGRRINDKRSGEPKIIRLDTDERCFLALSTIYGLRREELANLSPNDINLRSGAIYIATAKSGRERYHLIPEEIKQYLAAHDFTQRYAKATLSQMFKTILLKSGAGELRNQRLGWHSIRRALLDSLVDNGVSILAARVFLRWKGADREIAMPARYYGNVVVDLEETGPVLEEAKGDEDIFAKHPFLSLWR
ncbi:MAG: tyrosine-type recombinase/integrase [Dehalococcoidia bacterium]